jgi:hypothetical protein
MMTAGKMLNQVAHDQRKTSSRLRNHGDSIVDGNGVIGVWSCPLSIWYDQLQTLAIGKLKHSEKMEYSNFLKYNF